MIISSFVKVSRMKRVNGINRSAPLAFDTYIIQLLTIEAMDMM